MFHFVEEISRVFFFFPFYCFSLFLCIAHLRRLFFLYFVFNLSLLFSEILNSVGFAFPFLSCLLLLFSAICKTSFRQPLCPLAFLFLWVGFCHCLLYNATNLCPQFFKAVCLPDLFPWIFSSPPLSKVVSKILKCIFQCSILIGKFGNPWPGAIVGIMFSE